MTREDSNDSTVAKVCIERVMKGDEEAFTWLYKNYSKKVYFLATQFFRSESMAEDIVQEVFIQIHKKIHTLQNIEAFNAWLHTITYRTCVDHKRRKIVLTQFENVSDEELYIEDTNKSISEYLEDQRVQTIIVETLEDMKLPLRVVGQLKFLEEMKNIEIAEVLDIPNSTVSHRVKTIKEILQRSLEKNGITKSSYGMVLVSPIVLHEAYQMIFNGHMMSEVASNRILNNVLTGTIKEVGKRSISYIAKYILGITLTISSVLIFWQVNQKENTVAIKPQTVDIQPIVEENAKIVDIKHSTQWQYTAVTLDVETTNDNYDTITINDIETLKISNNGTYTVKLVKDGNVVDQQEVTISNIDLRGPTAQSKKDDTNYYFYITDEVSGIHWDSLQYYKNGAISTDYSYNKNENVIIIPNDGVSTHKVYISDYASNVCEIHIT